MNASEPHSEPLSQTSGDLSPSSRGPRGWVVEQVRDPIQPERIQGACALWRQYQVLSEAEIERRASEVFVVAVDRASDQVVGVSTCYLGVPSQLQLPMWIYRTFVAPEWRGYVIYRMWQVAFDYHEERFLAGTETRAKGMYVEIQNKEWKAAHTEAVWSRGWLTYVGPSQTGADCRVAYFKGATIR